jgi:hypothetical protein
MYDNHYAGGHLSAADMRQPVYEVRYADQYTMSLDGPTKTVTAGGGRMNWIEARDYAEQLRMRGVTTADIYVIVDDELPRLLGLGG